MVACVLDDGSGRQRWFLVPIPESNLYNIRVADGTANGRIWLSVTCAGDHADLWTKDDGSGRQRWSIHSNPAIPNGYNIRVHNGASMVRTFCLLVTVDVLCPVVDAQHAQVRTAEGLFSAPPKPATRSTSGRRTTAAAARSGESSLLGTQ